MHKNEHTYTRKSLSIYKYPCTKGTTIVMFQNVYNVIAQQHGPAALQPDVNPAGFAPEAGKTEGAPVDNLPTWLSTRQIQSVFLHVDPDEVKLEKDWNLLQKQGTGACVPGMVFKPKTCANMLQKLIKENGANESCLTVICDRISGRGAENVLESLEDRVERLLRFLQEEKSKLQQVYFIFPTQLAGGHLSKLQSIGDLFKDTHSNQIYYSRRTQASVTQEHGPMQDSTFMVLDLQLKKEQNVAGKHVSADMGAHHAGGDARDGIGVGAHGDCDSSRVGKRKRDGQGGAYVRA